MLDINAIVFDNKNVELPSGWELTKLKNKVPDIEYGLSKAIPKTKLKNGIKIVSTADITKNDEIVYDSIRYIDVENKPVSRIILKDEDLLFNWRNSSELIGKCGIFRSQPEEHIFASFILRLRCNRDIINNYFLKFLFRYYRNNEIFVKLSRRAVNQANYNKNEIYELRIACPPLQEQKKIAYILSTIQKAIEQQDKVIRTTTELKKALMQKLFTEGIKGKKQKKTEMGLVPESWNKISIGDFGKCITGTTPKTSIETYWNSNDYDFIAPADLGSTRYVYDSAKKMSEYGLAVSRILPQNSVMCVCIGSSIGKVEMAYKKQSATNQQLNSIICNENFNPIYIYYLLNQYAEYWRNHATFGPVPILNKGQFEAVKIYTTTDLTEQKYIAETLIILDTKIELHLKKKLSLSSLFKTMLYELMTGKRRVNEIDFKTMNEE